MTLFNGLLCAAGDKRGCAAVANSQDPKTGQDKYGVASLPSSSRLRGALGSFSAHNSAITAASALFNDPGFSQHLVAVTIWIMEKIGDKDTLWSAESRTLAAKPENAGNAFCDYLSSGSGPLVDGDIVAHCPPVGKKSLAPRNQ
jgi:hypothetical protein